jgi:hypothetical protein
MLLSLLTVIILLPAADDSGDWRLRQGCAGEVCLGMPVAKLRHLPGWTLQFTDLRLEGEPAPAALLTRADGGEVSLTAEFDARRRDSLVARITVRDRRYRTRCGIGVGSTLGMLRKQYRVNWITQGEPDAVARVDGLGMSFLLDLKPLGKRAPDLLRRQKVPDSVRITGVMLTD